MYHFQGKIEGSKSILIRALLAQSYCAKLEIADESSCDDVAAMKRGLAALHEGTRIDCGEAGAVIRFLALRASRKPGVYRLTGSPRLLARPMDGIESVLRQLGVSCRIGKSEIVIEGEGWKIPSHVVEVPSEKSSQFASALLLNAWNLETAINFSLMGKPVSVGYFDLSLCVAMDLGMRPKKLHANEWMIPAMQVVSCTNYSIEPDYSSVAAIAAMSAIFGQAHLPKMTGQSAQPDYRIFAILAEMGVSVDERGPTVVVQRPKEIRGIRVDLSRSPDLVPVLAVLCAFAVGPSTIYGVPQLVYKESDRLAKTCELLRAAGVRTAKTEDGLEVQGNGLAFHPRSFRFDPDQDHRMAMAAALLKKANPKIEISHPEVVAKSYPRFWQHAELS